MNCDQRRGSAQRRALNCAVSAAGGRVGLRMAWLAGTALAVLASQAVAAPAEVVTVGRSLTPSADILTLAIPTLAVNAAPAAFGIAAPQRAIGLDALAGNDVLTLTGTQALTGAVRQSRLYSRLPTDTPTLTLFTESPLTRMTLFGVDGGAGDDSLALSGQLGASATATFGLALLNMTASIPTTLNPESLTAATEATAAGLADTAGANVMNVTGRLDVDAVVTTSRGQLNLTVAQLANQPQLLTGDALATGLLAGASGDRLSIQGGGVVDVTATTTTSSTDVTISGLVVGSPESAVTASSVARGIDAGAGHDIIGNGGTINATATATVTEVSLSAVAAGYTLPEIIVPDTSLQSTGNARALGMVGGLGHDRLTNSSTINLSATSTYTRTSVAFTDAGIDGTAVETLIEPPTFPDEAPRGSVARIAGMLGDDDPLLGTGGGVDVLLNTGTITGTANATMTTAAVTIAVPINETTGFSNTGIGKLVDAVSFGLSDTASAAAATYATGMGGGAAFDTLTNNGAIQLTGTAKADTGQFTLNVADFLEKDDGGPGGGTSFSLSVDVFNTGAFALAQGVGMDGGAGIDKLITGAGSLVSVANTATARTLDAGVTVTTGEKSFNLAGSVVFSLSLAAAESVGLSGGADGDLFDSAGTITTNAAATVEALKANLTVDKVEGGMSLNAQVVEAGMQATAAATGIDATTIDDQVITGSITNSATSTVETAAVVVLATINTGKGIAGGGSFIGSDFLSEAAAIGIDRATDVGVPTILNAATGFGRTTIRQGAIITNTANSVLQRVGVGATLNVATRGAALGATVFDMAGESNTLAVGVRGSMFQDQVVSLGSIASIANATSLTTETTLTATGAQTGLAAGVGLVLGDLTTTGRARGVDLGNGVNTLVATAPITATASADANANTNAITLSGAMQGVAAGASVTKMKTSSVANAAAVAGGTGVDTLRTDGGLSAGATSNAKISAVTITVAGAVSGVGAGAGVILANGDSLATARGIDLGGGADDANLAGGASANATASLTSTSVGLAITGAQNGVGAGASVISSRFDSVARAGAASLGDGADQLFAARSLGSTGKSTTEVTSVAITASGALNGIALGVTALLSDAGATTDATTVDLGAGDDRADLDGPVTANANATAKNTGAAVTISGTNNGGAAGAAAIANNTTATSTARALAGGDGIDTIALFGADATADARTNTLDVAIAVSGSNTGIGVGAAVILADAASTARATTIDLGAGNDQLTLDGRGFAQATGNIETRGIGISIGGAVNGLGANASVLEADTRTTGDATALAGGTGNDTIDGLGSLQTITNATADSRSASVGVAATMNGISAGVAVANSETAATALGRGALLGAGNDSLILAGGSNTQSTARATSTSVSAQLSGSFQGIGVGVGLVDAKTTATAETRAADGGENDDVIVFGRRIDSTATSFATNTGISASIGFAVFGAGAAGADVQGSVLGQSDAFGLVGGSGSDTLTARDAVAVTSNATASQTNVALSASAAIGVSLSASFIDSALSAIANATGLAGDTVSMFAGNDTLTTDNSLTVNSTATATGASYSFAFNFGVGLGANVVTGGTRAIAVATGQNGDDGNDTLIANGTVQSTATATATGSALSATLTGANIGQLSNLARATAIGLNGGGQNDTITANREVTATSTATATANSAGIAFTGANIADVSNNAASTAIGITGGSGINVITAGRVTARATGRSTIDTVSAQLAGGSAATIGSVSNATATGIAGGGSSATITAADAGATADAAITAQSVAASLIGAAGQETSLTANAAATAVAGADTGFTTATLARLSADAIANATPTTIAVTLTGVNAGRIGTAATATANGYRGGGLSDVVDITERATISSRATTTASSIGVTLVGGTVSGTQAAATASSALALGGEGGGRITAAGQTDIDATANATANSTSISLASLVDVTLGTTATARTVGLGGGNGNDVFSLTGPGNGIIWTATANATSNSDTVQLAGGAIGRNRNIADATVVTIEAGGGNDDLTTAGTILMEAVATARGDRTEFRGVGGALSESGQESRARATGIDGGAGTNIVRTTGDLTVTANARSVDTNSTFILAGANIARQLTLLRASASGIFTGNGADTITNSGTLRVNAVAGGQIGSSSVTLAGAGFTSNQMQMVSLASGIVSGDGNDIVVNSGRLTGAATATGRSSAFAANLVGVQVGNSDNTATATFTGIDAGGGADQITNSGEMSLTSTATGASVSLTASLAGSTAVSARTIASTLVNGILAGAGDDIITNSGVMSLRANSAVSNLSRSIVLVGEVSGEAGYSAQADVLGIDGGADNDSITLSQAGRLDLEAAATLTSNASTLNLVGLASTLGIGNAAATLTGLSGGAGNDGISVFGRLDLRARSTLTATASNFTVIGATSQTGRFRTSSVITGLDGGAGDDNISVRLGGSVTATSNAFYSATGFSAIGVSSSESSIGGTARALGVNGGAGNNTLVLNATDGRAFSVAATATTTLLSNTRVFLGQATSSGAASSTATATGLSTDVGNQLIVTRTPLEVISRADVNFQSATLAFIGASEGQTAALANAAASGIRASTGNNDIQMLGGGTIRATAEAGGSASAGNSLGDARSAAVTTGFARADGLIAGGGDDLVRVDGVWTVDAGATISPRVTADSGVLFSDGLSRAVGSSVLSGALLFDGGGVASMQIASGARLTFTAGATTEGDDVTGVTRADALSIGKRGGVDVDSFASAEARSRMLGNGIVLGNDARTHGLNNAGEVRVNLVGIADARSTANGNAGISGDGTAGSIAIASGAQARGVVAGSPMFFINSGVVSANAAPTAKAEARGLATGINGLTTDPDGDATARAFASNVEAIGVQMAGGTLTNSGDIIASSRPTVLAIARGERGNTGSTSTDGIARTEARADDTKAFGVQSLSGFITINNSGRIDARAAPTLNALSLAVGTGTDGDVTSFATGTTNRTLAVGIDLGSGGSSITNSGQIITRTSQSRLVSAAANQSGLGSVTTDRVTNGSEASFGIRAAGGNNDITNTGDIQADISIQTGAGNDIIRLLGGATSSRILTGPGDDTVIIDNDPFVGSLIFMDAGTNDRLLINGPVTLRNGAAAMEYVLKTGPGQANFNTLDFDHTGTTRIESGSIGIVGGLFQRTHRLNTLIDAAGTNGALVVNSGLSSFAPRGALVVEIGTPGVFTNGRTWDVIQSNRIINTRELSVTLPAATAVVSFNSGLAAGSTRYRVQVNVARMSGLVSGGVERSFAAALDDATPIATGAVATTIQALQALPTRDALQAAVTVAAPATPLRSGAVAGAMLDSALAVSAAAPSQLGLAAPRMQGLMMLGQAAAPGASGQWTAAFNALPVANMGVGRGAAGGFASGFSARPTDDFEYGLGAVMMTAEQQFAGNAGGGFSQASMLTGRMAYAPAPDVTLNTSMALGVNRFSGSRPLLQGGSGIARQSGAMLAFDGGVAWALPSPLLRPVLSGGITYRRVNGDGLREGSTGMALLVDRSHWQRAEAQLGVRVAPSFALADVTVRTQFGAAMVHRLGGAQDGVRARFADMPDFVFTLDSGRQALTAMRWDAGLDIALGRWNLSAGITSRPDVGGRFTEGQIGLGLSF